MEHPLLVSRTACTTCDFSFITTVDDVVGVAHSSSDELLESEDDEEDESSSPFSSESSTGLGVTPFFVSAEVAGEVLG